MKLLTFEQGGKVRIGAAGADGWIVDLHSAAVAAGITHLPASMRELIAAGESGLAAARKAADFAASNPNRVHSLHAGEIIFHPPVYPAGKTCCVALNNSANDDRMISAPSHPAFFLKPPSCMVGHNQPIVLRESYGLTHPEPELAIVIGRRVRDLAAADAWDAVFGYTILDDITSAAMRADDHFHFYGSRRSPDGTMASVETHTTYPGRYKGSDTFGPIGPWIVTRDEIPDPHALTVTCLVDGRVVVTDSTANYRFRLPAVLEYLTAFQTLDVGDVVSLGTALGKRDAGGFTLEQADLQRAEGPVVVEISSIGALSNPVRHEKVGKGSAA
jgi:2-keto-4-pentenoate hydratase/2-oxohepta-3-ene-1,7-dioic acid hydratase in catechol pathway